MVQLLKILCRIVQVGLACQQAVSKTRCARERRVLSQSCFNSLSKQNQLWLCKSSHCQSRINHIEQSKANLSLLPKTFINAISCQLDYISTYQSSASKRSTWHSYTMTPGIYPLRAAIAVAQGDHQCWVANQITQHQHLPSVNANASTPWSPKVPLMRRVWFFKKGNLFAEEGEAECCHCSCKWTCIIIKQS